MWQWWTSQYGCYCRGLICRVSNCCLSLYLHIAGDYDRVLENTFGVLEFILGKTVGTPNEVKATPEGSHHHQYRLHKYIVDWCWGWHCRPKKAPHWTMIQVSTQKLVCICLWSCELWHPMDIYSNWKSACMSVFITDGLRDGIMWHTLSWQTLAHHGANVLCASWCIFVNTQQNGRDSEMEWPGEVWWGREGESQVGQFLLVTAKTALWFSFRNNLCAYFYSFFAKINSHSYPVFVLEIIFVLIIML